MTALPPFISRLSRKCRSLDVSEPHGLLRPVTGLTSLFCFIFKSPPLLKMWNFVLLRIEQNLEGTAVSCYCECEVPTSDAGLRAWSSVHTHPCHCRNSWHATWPGAAAGGGWTGTGGTGALCWRAGTRHRWECWLGTCLPCPSTCWSWRSWELWPATHSSTDHLQTVVSFLVRNVFSLFSFLNG
jgi:hypothetical protein